MGGRNSKPQCQKKPEITELTAEHDIWGPGPEAAESERAWLKCIKNPGHKSFIPVGEFSKHLLPEGYQNDHFAELIQIWSSLTVRLRVFDTSPARPNDGGRYSLDKGWQRLGTGFVYHVQPMNNGTSATVSEEGKPQKQSWLFAINTAKHVIYDDYEAKSTMIDFFHDYEGSRDDGTMKTLGGERVWFDRDRDDISVFQCECDDDQLGEKMKFLLDEWKRLHRTVSAPVKLMVVISHPHGRPKQVTIGQWKCSEKGRLQFNYTTDTCPGSSGAAVFGWWSDLSHDRRYSGVTHCHGGGPDGCNGGFYNILI